MVGLGSGLLLITRTLCSLLSLSLTISRFLPAHILSCHAQTSSFNALRSPLPPIVPQPCVRCVELVELAHAGHVQLRVLQDRADSRNSFRFVFRCLQQHIVRQHKMAPGWEHSAAMDTDLVKMVIVGEEESQKRVMVEE